MEKVVLEVKVQPGASRDAILGFKNGILGVTVKAKAEGGKANEALIKLLAKVLSLSPSSLRILRGRTQRRKLIEICGISPQKAVELLSGSQQSFL